MKNFEEMYSQFRLDEETKEKLNQFADRKYPFEECISPFLIKTVVGGSENDKKTVVNHAELV